MLMTHCNTNKRCLLSARLCCSQEVLQRVPYPARKDTGNLQWHLLTVLQNCRRLPPAHHHQAASHPSILFSISLWGRLECLPACACDRTPTHFLSKLGTTNHPPSPTGMPAPLQVEKQKLAGKLMGNPAVHNTQMACARAAGAAQCKVSPLSTCRRLLLPIPYLV